VVVIVSNALVVGVITCGLQLLFADGYDGYFAWAEVSQVPISEVQTFALLPTVGD